MITTGSRPKDSKYSHERTQHIKEVNSDVEEDYISTGSNQEIEYCGDFQRGRCFRLVCKYAHEYRNDREAYGDGGGDTYHEREACKDFLRGRCERDYNCRYAHAPNATQYYDPPPFSGYSGYSHPYDHYHPFSYYHPSYFAPQGYYSRNRRQVTCRDYMNGRCKRGSSCKYRHEKEICGDFLRGECSRVECRFSHSKSDGEKCRDYHRGVCHRGEDCRYFHEDDEELAKKRKLDDNPEAQRELSIESVALPGSRTEFRSGELVRSRKEVETGARIRRTRIETGPRIETETERTFNENDRPTKMMKSNW